MRKKLLVAIVGNPNVGKTTLFNIMTGEDAHVGNWPGVTVDIMEGSFDHNQVKIEMVDLPGIYSISPYSPDEIVTCDFIIREEPDLIINIVDSSALENTLYTTIQLLEMGVPVIVALNKVDMANERNVHLNIRRLSRKIKCPIVPIVASKGIGIPDLKDAILHEAHHHGRSDIVHPILHDRFDHDDEEKRENRSHKHEDRMFHRRRSTGFHLDYGSEMEEKISTIMEMIGDIDSPPSMDSRWLSINLLEGNDHIRDLISSRKDYGEVLERSSELGGPGIELNVADIRHDFIREILPRGTGKKMKQTLSDKLDRVLTDKYTGLPIFLIFIWAVFQITFGFGDPISGIVDTLFGSLGDQISVILNGWIESLIVDGIINGVGAVIVFFPYIFILYFLISIMEETGYMSRGAYVLDGIMARFNLPGRSFIPMIMGFGCTVPAIISARTIPNKKDRLATIMVIPFASCSARMPVYILLAGTFFSRDAGMVIFFLYLTGIVVLLGSAKLFKSTILKGEPTPFLMELPPYKKPKLRTSLREAFRNTLYYLKKAGTVILVAMIVIWGISHFNFNGYLESSQKDVNGIIIISEGVINGTGTFTSRGSEVTVSGVLLQDLSLYEDEIQEGEILDREIIDIPDGAIFSLNGTVTGPVIFTGNGTYTGPDFIIEESLAADLGRTLSPLFKPLGFDWKIVVSLIFGLVAKEVIVGTMGVLFGVSDDDEALSDSLEDSSSFSPLISLQMMAFILLYIPCIPAIVTIKKETGSWKWAAFSLAYTTIVAYAAALMIRVGGLLIGV